MYGEATELFAGPFGSCGGRFFGTGFKLDASFTCNGLQEAGFLPADGVSGCAGVWAAGFYGDPCPVEGAFRIQQFSLELFTLFLGPGP